MKPDEIMHEAITDIKFLIGRYNAARLNGVVTLELINHTIIKAMRKAGYVGRTT